MYIVFQKKSLSRDESSKMKKYGVQMVEFHERKFKDLIGRIEELIGCFDTFWGPSVTLGKL